MNLKKFLSALCAMALLCGVSAAQTPETVKVASPNGKLEMSVWLKNGSPIYTVNFEGKPVILESAMGIISNGSWADNAKIKGVDISENKSSWKPVYGERSEIPDNYRQAVIHFENGKKELDIVVRAYNEGVAFRYVFAGTKSYLRITDELTEFALPAGTQGYYTVRAQTPYEKMAIDPAVWSKKECDRPLTLELPDGTFLSLGEAEVVNYARTKFVVKPGKTATIGCSMYGEVDEIEPYATPWRVIMAAKKPGELIENNFIFLNLNPPCAIADTKWIKPGKVMRAGLSTESAKKVIDFAAAHNLQYAHIDAGWYGSEYLKTSDATKPRNGLNIEEVVNYGKSKGIGLWLYVNQRALAQQLDEVLDQFQKWGVVGIKFGFVQVGSQGWTMWMHDAVRRCAEHGLMVDIHDEYRPTGFSRTYPNLLTQEGIRGNEEFPDAKHNVTLPFTRFVCGAADYTICYYKRDFSQYDPNEKSNYHARPERVIKATPAHQLAMAVVYYSPLQFMFWYDSPGDYKGEPEIEFFEKVPTVWDETKALDGKIGEYVSMARRSGDVWYVGVMNGMDARDLKLSFDFLPAGKKYEARIFTDGPMSLPTRTKVAIESKQVTSKTVLDLPLKATGGAAIYLVPAKK